MPNLISLVLTTSTNLPRIENRNANGAELLMKNGTSSGFPNNYQSLRRGNPYDYVAAHISSLIYEPGNSNPIALIYKNSGSPSNWQILAEAPDGSSINELISSSKTYELISAADTPQIREITVDYDGTAIPEVADTVIETTLFAPATFPEEGLYAI